MCSHRSAWLTHNENCRTDGSHDASLKQEIFPAKNILVSCRHFGLPQMLSQLLFAKCENMNLLVIDLLLSHKAQIFGNWAKKKWDIHHQNKQHAEPGFVKSNFCVHETDQRRFLQMAADHVSGSRPTRKKKKKMWEKEGKWAQNQHSSCLKVFSPSEKPQIWDAVTGRQRVQCCQFGRQSSAAAKRCC